MVHAACTMLGNWQPAFLRTLSKPGSRRSGSDWSEKTFRVFKRSVFVKKKSFQAKHLAKTQSVWRAHCWKGLIKSEGRAHCRKAPIQSCFISKFQIEKNAKSWRESKSNWAFPIKNFWNFRIETCVNSRTKKTKRNLKINQY